MWFLHTCLSAYPLTPCTQDFFENDALCKCNVELTAGDIRKLAIPLHKYWSRGGVAFLGHRLRHFSAPPFLGGFKSDRCKPTHMQNGHVGSCNLVLTALWAPAGKSSLQIEAYVQPRGSAVQCLPDGVAHLVTFIPFPRVRSAFLGIRKLPEQASVIRQSHGWGGMCTIRRGCDSFLGAARLGQRAALLATVWSQDRRVSCSAVLARPCSQRCVFRPILWSCAMLRGLVRRRDARHERHIQVRDVVESVSAIDEHPIYLICHCWLHLPCPARAPASNGSGQCDCFSNDAA